MATTPTSVDFPTKHLMRWINRFMMVLMLHIRPDSQVTTMRARLIRYARFAAVAIATAMSLRMAYGRLSRMDSLHFLSKDNVRILMSLTRYIQALCCIQFIYSWQRHGQILAYLTHLDDVTNKCAASKKIQVAIYAEQLAIASFVLFQAVGTVLSVMSVCFRLMPSKSADLFGMRGMMGGDNGTTTTATPISFDAVVTYFARIWLPMVWYMCFAYFSTCTRILMYEVKYFNDSLRFNKRRLADRDYLLRTVTQHVRLSNCVDELNTIFSTFIFVALSLNIPMIIMTGFATLGDAGDITLTQLVIILGSTLMPRLVEFIYLSVTPARIAAEMQESRDVVMGECRVWVPYDEHMHTIANTFCSRMDTPTNGITASGFATLTKPFALTIVSIVITYLTLLMQFQQSGNEEETKNNKTIVLEAAVHLLASMNITEHDILLFAQNITAEAVIQEYDDQ